MIILVVGGASSGKSQIGERLAAGLAGPVTFVATGVGVDADMAARIAAHQARRPPAWATLEVAQGGDLATVLHGLTGTALVDSLGTWVAGTVAGRADGEGELYADGEGALCGALVSRDGDTVMVSDEVGLGVHPTSEAGRRFRDALGQLNRQVAEVADRVLLVVAGQVLRLDRPGDLAEVAGLARPGGAGGADDWGVAG